MAKNITSVSWEASNLPSGLSFDTATGTFSGTPSGEGEYIVPVSVKTNYGEDSKDVTIRALKAYPVYAMGGMAATWSENAEPDANGFRKLNMPDAVRLVPLIEGFGAKTKSGKWYVCGNKAIYYGYTNNEINPTTPVELPINDISDMSCGWKVEERGTDFQGSYFIYKLVNNQCNIIYFSEKNSTVTISELDNVSRISKNVGYVNIAYLNNDTGEINGINVNAEKVKSLTYNYGKVCYLTSDGELFEGDTKISFDFGNIKEIYPPVAYSQNNNVMSMQMFCLTNDNDLYVIGNNADYRLGLPNSTNYSEFVKVGNFDVKTIASVRVNSNFLLTNNGELYHTGVAISGITEAHNGFTRIFPQYKFHDIAGNFKAGLGSSKSTLIALIEE